MDFIQIGSFAFKDVKKRAPIGTLFYYMVENYLPAVIFAISSAKFSSFFWMPSPFSKR